MNEAEKAAMHAAVDARAKQLHTLIDASEHFNSNITQVVGRDDDDRILFVAVFCEGESANDLAEFCDGLAD